MWFNFIWNSWEVHLNSIWSSYELLMNFISMKFISFHMKFVRSSWTWYEVHMKFTINSYVDHTNFIWSYAYLVSYGLHMNEPPGPSYSTTPQVWYDMLAAAFRQNIRSWLLPSNINLEHQMEPTSDTNGSISEMNNCLLSCICNGVYQFWAKW